jgi:hypothetical protein
MDDNQQMTVRTLMAVDDILERNTRLRNETVGERWGDGKKGSLDSHPYLAAGISRGSEGGG